jgi:hypothetical protein
MLHQLIEILIYHACMHMHHVHLITWIYNLNACCTQERQLGELNKQLKSKVSF